MTDKPVKLYALTTCSHCKSTKRLLDECTIQYDIVDVDLTEGEERKAILVRHLSSLCGVSSTGECGTAALGCGKQSLLILVRNKALGGANTGGLCPPALARNPG